jgi:hypothetical protein
LIIKILSKIGIEVHVLILIKGMYENSTADIIFNDERLKSHRSISEVRPCTRNSAWRSLAGKST